MNQELFEKSTGITCRIIALRRTIRSCNTAVENISHGADVTVKGTNKINIMKQCSLDDGQEKLMQDMLITILKNRMEEAEIELEGLLPEEVKNE